MLLVVKILSVILFLICSGFIAYWIVVWWKGDAILRLQNTKMSALKVESMSLDTVTLSFTVPIVNVGKQIGTIMDAFVRTYLPYEQFDGVKIETLLTAADDPREDGYWQAFIMEKGVPKTFLVKLTFKGKTGNILRDMEDLPDLPLDILYQVVARSDYYYAKKRLYITTEELRRVLYQYTTEVRNHG